MVRRSVTIALLAALLLASTCTINQVCLDCDGTGGYSCFVAGTEVATVSGARKIEHLKIGEAIFSYSHTLGKIVHRRLVAIKKSQRTSLLQVNSIRGVTPEHPIYSQTAKKYVRADQLMQRDQLIVLRHGQIDLVAAMVSPAGLIAGTTPIIHEVYDLSVEGPEHNFFADKVLVHNKSFPAPLGITAIVADASYVYAVGESEKSESPALRKFDKASLVEIPTASFSYSQTGSSKLYKLIDTSNFLFARGYRNQTEAIVKVSKADGLLAPGFASSGSLTLPGSYGGDPVAADATDLYVLIRLTYQSSAVRKYAMADGSLTAAFGSSGELGLISAFDVRQIFYAGSALWLVGNYGTYPAYSWRIEKRNPVTGALDTTFNGTGVLSIGNSAPIFNAAIDATAIYILASDSAIPAAIVAKLLLTGAIDTSFGNNGYASFSTNSFYYTNRIEILGTSVELQNPYSDNIIHRLSSGTGAIQASYTTASLGGFFYATQFLPELTSYVVGGYKDYPAIWQIRRIAK